MKACSHPADINWFRSHTGNFLSDTTCQDCSVYPFQLDVPPQIHQSWWQHHVHYTLFLPHCHFLILDRYIQNFSRLSWIGVEKILKSWQSRIRSSTPTNKQLSMKLGRIWIYSLHENFSRLSWIGAEKITFPHIALRAEWRTKCSIIGDVHRFIGHCLIPLDPCNYLSLFLFQKLA